MTLTDASPLVALINAKDNAHNKCMAVLPSLPAPLLTTWERLVDHAIVTRSDYIPRIQEAQASVYHVLRQRLEDLKPGK